LKGEFTGGLSGGNEKASKKEKEAKEGLSHAEKLCKKMLGLMKDLWARREGGRSSKKKKKLERPTIHGPGHQKA